MNGSVEMETFRERLIVALNAARMSQTALAESLGLSRAAVNLWLTPDDSRRTEPPLKKKYIIAHELGVDGDWLAKGVGPGPEVLSVMRESRVRYGHRNPSKLLMDQVIQTVKANNIKDLEYFDVRLPSLLVDHHYIEFDFVSPRVIAEIKALPRSGAQMPFYRSAWNLAISARLDKRMHVGRRHLLIVMTDPDVEVPQHLTLEAGMLDVEVVPATTVDDILSALKLL